MIIITYRSYKMHYDKEVYTNQAAAEYRYEQLKKCEFVDKLTIRGV
jgi:hypothetical protein